MMDPWMSSIAECHWWMRRSVHLVDFVRNQGGQAKVMDQIDGIEANMDRDVSDQPMRF